MQVDLSVVPDGCPWNLFFDGNGFTAEVWADHQSWVQDEEPIEVWAETPQAAIDGAVDELKAHGVYPELRPALPAGGRCTHDEDALRDPGDAA